MNKTSDLDTHRTFLIDALPGPLNAASSHLQIYDNYIHSTRLRLRKIRDPYTGKWTYVLQQIVMPTAGETGYAKTSEIHLNEAEYTAFKLFERYEIRKNRYFHEFDRMVFAFDVYLGELAGLTTARADFDSAEDMANFEPPSFAVIEITSEPFFSGANLVGMSYEEIRAEVELLGKGLPRQVDMSDE